MCVCMCVLSLIQMLGATLTCFGSHVSVHRWAHQPRSEITQKEGHTMHEKFNCFSPPSLCRQCLSYRNFCREKGLRPAILFRRRHSTSILDFVYLMRNRTTTATITEQKKYARTKTPTTIRSLSLESAGHGRHADERVRGNNRDVLVQAHHQGLQLFRHLPRVPARGRPLRPLLLLLLFLGLLTRL